MNIVQEPNEILHKVCSKVTLFDNELKELSNQMTNLMKEKNAGGLAAPQINKSIRLAVIQWKNNNNDLIGLTLVNPEIIAKSDKFTVYKEECLSLSNKFTVKRPREVTVKYQDIIGDYHQITGQNYFSHVLQHEVDHLDGKLISD